MVRHRRAFLAAAGTVVSATLAGCADVLGEGLSDDDFDVGMSANAFLPDTHRVGTGETVVWGNNSSRGHTVTAYETAIPEEAQYFASGGYDDEQTARDAWRDDGGGNIPPGETYEHTFEVPGEYPYSCLPHESKGMVGTIVVEE